MSCRSRPIALRFLITLSCRDATRRARRRPPGSGSGTCPASWSSPRSGRWPAPLRGCRLVERGRAGTQLTPAGEEFLRYAVDVTQALESAAAVLTGAAAPVTPAVRVGALPTVAGGLLVDAIARMHARRPHAAVSVRTGDNPELLAWLKSGDIDV